MSRPPGTAASTPFLRSLTGQCADLVTTIGADRVTVRLDLPGLGLQVDRVAAEACAVGVAPLSGDGSIDQRRLATVAWLVRHRTMLIQHAFVQEPFPPRALIDAYGVRAQVLAPLMSGGALVGWVSVHQCRTRVWGPADVAAVTASVSVVAELVGATG